MKKSLLYSAALVALVYSMPSVAQQQSQGAVIQGSGGQFSDRARIERLRNGQEPGQRRSPLQQGSQLDPQGGDPRAGYKITSPTGTTPEAEQAARAERFKIQKAQMLGHIIERQQELSRAQSCVQAAQNPDELRGCKPRRRD